MEDNDVDAQVALVRKHCSERTEEAFVPPKVTDEEYNRAAQALALRFERACWGPDVLDKDLMFPPIKASKEASKFIKIKKFTLSDGVKFYEGQFKDVVDYVPIPVLKTTFHGECAMFGPSFFDLGDDEATPVVPPKVEVKEAGVVSSCPPPKSDHDQRMERGADLLRDTKGEVRLRQPFVGKRCYVCDHHERGVAPSRVSGALLCVLCAANLVDPQP